MDDKMKGKYMAITDKTRKILQAKSGKRCAICKTELIMNSKSINNIIVGDECHIISKQKNGPRYHPDHGIKLDNYENLILLCKTHHILIDNDPEEYSVEKLKKIKKDHEDWVNKVLGKGAIRYINSSEEKEKIDEFLPRILSGQEIVNIVQGALFYDYSNCELNTQEEVDLIGAFAEALQDYGDILDELGVGQRIEVEYLLKNMLEDIETKGFFVFGSRMKKRLKLCNVDDMWDIAVVRVLRQDDPSIIKIDLNKK